MANTGRQHGAAAFWPWGRRSAIAATAVLLLVLVGGVALLRIVAGWPDARWEGAFVLAAVLLSLLPIGLLILESVAESQGSVSIRGVSVNFGATAQAAAAAVTRSTLAIPRNVADEGVAIGDSGHSEVLSVLREASRADVVVVDLEDGHAWWESRLLLLCAGAELQGRPRTVVFVATVHGLRRRFVGWADPADVVTQLLRADPELEFAYAVARTSVRRAELTFPGRAATGLQANVTAAVTKDPPPGPVVVDQELFERRAELMLPQPPAMAFTRALARSLRAVEESGKVGHVSVMRLLELLTPVLHTAHIEETASDDDWVRAVVDLESEYLVVTAGEVYRGLAPRTHLVSSLLRAIVSSLTTTTAAGQPPSSAPATPSAAVDEQVSPQPVASTSPHESLLIPPARAAASQPPPLSSDQR